MCGVFPEMSINLCQLKCYQEHTPTFPKTKHLFHLAEQRCAMKQGRILLKRFRTLLPGDKEMLKLTGGKYVHLFKYMCKFNICNGITRV